MRRVLSRFLLVFGVGVIATVILVSSVSLSAAQPSDGPSCADRWLRDWYVWDSSDGSWFYYWWYQYCEDPSQGGWFKAYDSWEWGPPVDDGREWGPPMN